MSINRWTDEVMVHMYNGILLNHKKEWIWVSWTEVAEPRACYTEWSKSEREKQILYISTYISEKAMAPHSSTLAWKIPWTEEPGKLQSMGSRRVGYDWATSLSLSRIGEGNGNPLQCSCLENPRDGGAWWAAVYGVAQSRTQLKWLSSSSSKAAYSSFGPLLFILLNAAPHLSSLPVTLYCCTLYIWTLTSNISISIDHDH